MTVDMLARRLADYVQIKIGDQKWLNDIFTKLSVLNTAEKQYSLNLYLDSDINLLDSVIKFVNDKIPPVTTNTTGASHLLPCIN